jgi:hypothetical protein
MAAGRRTTTILDGKDAAGPAAETAARPRHRNLDSVKRSVEGLRQLQQRIRKRSRSALSPAEVRAAIEYGRK